MPTATKPDNRLQPNAEANSMAHDSLCSRHPPSTKLLQSSCFMIDLGFLALLTVHTQQPRCDALAFVSGVYWRGVLSSGLGKTENKMRPHLMNLALDSRQPLTKRTIPVTPSCSGFLLYGVLPFTAVFFLVEEARPRHASSARYTLPCANMKAPTIR